MSFTVSWLTYLEPCKFSYYYLYCDLAPIKMYLFGILVFSIPSAYIAASIIRQQSKFTLKGSKSAPGISYIIVLLTKLILEFFGTYVFYYDYHSIDRDQYFKLSFVTIDLYIYALSQFFVCICKVILVFNAIGSKIIYYLAVAIQYFFLAAFLVRLFCVFIPLSDKAVQNIFDVGGVYVSIIIRLKFVIWALCMLILSICFVFSNITNYIPSYYRKPMKCIMFYFPLGVFAVSIAENIRAGFIFGISMVLVKQQWLNMFLTSVENYACNIAIVALVVVLSSQDWAEKHGDESAKVEHEIDLALEI